MKKLISLLILLWLAGFLQVQAMSVHLSGTITADSTGCQAAYTYHADSLHTLMIHFLDTSTPHNLITTWHWDLGDGSTSTTMDPTHLYVTSGLFSVCLTIATSTGCTSTICDSIEVGGEPPSNCENNFTYTSALLTFSFHGTPNSPYPTIYTWHMGDPAGTILTGQNVTFTYPVSGPYNVTLVTVDSTNCDWTRTKEIYAHATCDVNGYVYMGVNPVDHGWIDLIRVDSNNVMTIVQSKEFGDSLGSYHFGGVGAGSYYLKAQLLPASTRYGHFMPTYYEESLNWQGATLVIAGQSQGPFTIHLVECDPAAPGNGNIQGRIIQSGVKISGNGTGTADIEVMLFDANNNPLGYTKTDTTGSFIFANIAYGTYNVKPEKAGTVSTGAQTIIDNNHPSVTLPFTLTGGQILYGIGDPGANISYLGELYPNPASGQIVNFRVNCNREMSMVLSLFNALGQSVTTSEVQLAIGPNTVELNISGLRAGPYYLKIRTSENKVIIRKLTIIGETH